MDILSLLSIIVKRLLPVTCIVIRLCYATNLKSLVTTLILSLSIEVNYELTVETLEERIVWH